MAGKRTDGMGEFLPYRRYVSTDHLAPDDYVTAPYLREPYVRVVLPDLGSVDAKATRWSHDVVIIHWKREGDGIAENAIVPASWCQRIDRKDSAYRDPYDKLDG